MLTQRTQSALFAFVLTLFALTTTFAQTNKPRESPAMTATGQTNGKTITIMYGQPSVKGRKIFGGLEPYGKVWRTGANETTTIEFSDDVTVEGKAVPKGKYALFTIPGETDWTVIINKGIKWGAYSYKQDEDITRVTVPAKKTAAPVEKLTFDVASNGTVTMQWADTAVSFQVK